MAGIPPMRSPRRSRARGAAAARSAGTGAGVRRRPGLSLSHAATPTRAAPSRPIAQALAGAARSARMCSRFPATTTGSTAWSRSRARFCRPERGFAGCRTRQTRSYFALHLPRDWWLRRHRPAARCGLRRAAGALLPARGGADVRPRERDPVRAGAAVDLRVHAIPKLRELQRAHAGLFREADPAAPGARHRSPATCISTSGTRAARACRRSSPAEAAPSCIPPHRPRDRTLRTASRAGGATRTHATSATTGLAQPAVPLHQPEGLLAAGVRLCAVGLVRVVAAESRGHRDVLRSALQSALTRGGARSGDAACG